MARKFNRPRLDLALHAAQPRRGRRGSSRALLAGDTVEVASVAEIMATVDADGTLDGMPFMPEMLEMVGRTFTVEARADTTCFGGAQLREIDDSVHLAGVRCSGAAHGGCQAGCLLFWKESWLRRPDDAPGRKLSTPDDRVVRQNLDKHTRRVDPTGGEALYRCQATDIPSATRPIHFWDVRHFVRDMLQGNLKKRTVARHFVPYLINVFQTLSLVRLPERLRIAGGNPWPFVHGTLTKTPPGDLDLQPGELVQVLSQHEISATLDRKGRNRGMTFTPEMLEHTGATRRVARRVTRLIDEQSGRMVYPPGDCLVLEDTVCNAKFLGLCNRQTESYWREVWLRRSPDPDAPVTLGSRGVNR